MRYRLQDEAERVLQREVTMGAGNENLKSQILELEQRLATATAERNKARGLVGTGLGSRQALARLEENVTGYKNRINLLHSSIRKNDVNFDARLKELSYYFNQPIRAGEKLPRTLTLVSPLGGYVLYVDPALNPGSGAVGGDGISRVAAGILYHPVRTDGFTVGDQHGGAPVLEGQGGHAIIHL